MEQFVKSILSLSHGNADIERGFSRSALVMPEDRAQMLERTLNAILNVKEGIKGKPISIDTKLLKLGMSASSSYTSYLELCKANAEKEEIERESKIVSEQKRKILDEEIKISKEKENKLKIYKIELNEINAAKKKCIQQNQNLYGCCSKMY